MLRFTHTHRKVQDDYNDFKVNVDDIDDYVNWLSQQFAWLAC